MYIDSHCHLDSPQWRGRVGALLSAMARAQITRVWHMSVDMQLLSSDVLDKAASVGVEVLQAQGLHPFYYRQCLPAYGVELGNACVDAEKYSAVVYRALQDSWCSDAVAVGETGLDKRIACSMPLQQAIVHAHIQYALVCDKPLVLHCVQAHGVLLSMLQHAYQKCVSNVLRGVVHGFTGAPELARAYVRVGFCVGIGTALLSGRYSKLERTVYALPLEYLLIETDSPDGWSSCGLNKPWRVQAVVAKIAQIKGCSVQQVCRAQEEVLHRLVGC